MIEMYEEKITNKIVEGNNKVDNLVNRALNRNIYKTPSLTPKHGKY